MSIQKMRLKRGWSQQQLADVSGLSLRTVQRIESGGVPSLESLKSLGSVFETSIQDLQGNPDMPAPTTTESNNETVALKHGRDLRKFAIHATV